MISKFLALGHERSFLVLEGGLGTRAGGTILLFVESALSPLSLVGIRVKRTTPFVTTFLYSRSESERGRGDEGTHSETMKNEAGWSESMPSVHGSSGEGEGVVAFEISDVKNTTGSMAQPSVLFFRRSQAKTFIVPYLCLCMPFVHVVSNSGVKKTASLPN